MRNVVLISEIAHLAASFPTTKRMQQLLTGEEPAKEFFFDCKRQIFLVSMYVSFNAEHIIFESEKFTFPLHSMALKELKYSFITACNAQMKALRVIYK